MTNIKPCPFCGGEAEIVDVCNDCFISGKVGVGCSKCPVIIAEYGEYKVFDSEAEAIEAWNTRAERTCQRVNNPDQFFADNLEYSVDAYRCSVCNFRLDRITNYCPNCGAKVVEE